MTIKHLGTLGALALFFSLSGCAIAPFGPTANNQTLDATPLSSVFVSDRISVSSVGRGPDIVLIPGLSSSPRVFELLVKAMPDRRFHLVQIKGFAGTKPEANAQGPVVAPVAEEIVRYVSSQLLRKPALIGHSLGGTWAMLVSTRHPDLVERVMIVDTMPFVGGMFGGKGTTAASVEPIAARIRDQMVAATDEQRRLSIGSMVNGMVNSAARRGEVVADSLASDSKVSAQAYYDMLTTDLTASLSKFRGPFDVLFVTPKGAPMTDAQFDELYADIYTAAPNRVVKRISDSSHFIMFDQPARFESEVRRFLARR